MAPANERQIAEWNGVSGRNWLTHQARFDAMLAAHTEALIDAASPRTGEAVLDVGCGSGGATLAIAKAGGRRGRLIGIDVSHPLLQLACARASRAGVQADFVWADASRHPFLPGTFDLLVSRLGVMFFDHPIAAFARLRETLRAGGRCVFLAWRSAAENEGVALPAHAALHTLAPPAPTPPEAPGPFSFGDRNKLESRLRDAGFGEIHIAPFDAPLRFGIGATEDEALDDAVQMAFHLGPLRRLLGDQPEEIREVVCRDVRNAFKAKLSGGSVVLASAAWIVSAYAGNPV